MFGSTFDSYHSGSGMLPFVSVADDCREDFKRWDIGVNVITAIHGKLTVFGGHEIESNDLFWIDDKGL